MNSTWANTVGAAHDTFWYSRPPVPGAPQLARLLFWRVTIDENVRDRRTNMARRTALVTWAASADVPFLDAEANKPISEPFEIVFSSDGSNWVSTDGKSDGRLVGRAGVYKPNDPKTNSAESMAAHFEQRLKELPPHIRRDPDLAATLAADEQIRFTVRADGNRTVQLWGRITGHSFRSADGVLVSAEVSAGRVHDTGLREALLEIDEWRGHATGAQRAAYDRVLARLGLLQPLDVPASTTITEITTTDESTVDETEA